MRREDKVMKGEWKKERMPLDRVWVWARTFSSLFISANCLYRIINIYILCIYIYNIYHYLYIYIYIFHVIISFVPSTEVRAQHRHEIASAVFHTCINEHDCAGADARRWCRGRCSNARTRPVPWRFPKRKLGKRRAIDGAKSVRFFFLFFSPSSPFFLKEKFHRHTFWNPRFACKSYANAT